MDGAATAGPPPLRMLWITAAWGACFVAIRWGLRDAPVLWFATLRSLVAGAALVAFATAQRRPLPTGGRAWRLIGMLALTNSGIAFAAMFAGVAGLATPAPPPCWPTPSPSSSCSPRGGSTASR